MTPETARQLQAANEKAAEKARKHLADLLTTISSGYYASEVRATENDVARFTGSAEFWGTQAEALEA